MTTFIIRRVATIIPTLVFVARVIFGLQQLLPGDPAMILAGEERDPTVFPGAPVANSPSARTGTTASANPPSAIGEPRRVRTVPIKPDANDMASSLPSGAADQLPPPPQQSKTSHTPAPPGKK